MQGAKERGLQCLGSRLDTLRLEVGAKVTAGTNHTAGAGSRGHQVPTHPPLATHSSPWPRNSGADLRPLNLQEPQAHS